MAIGGFTLNLGGLGACSSILNLISSILSNFLLHVQHEYEYCECDTLFAHKGRRVHVQPRHCGSYIRACQLYTLLCHTLFTLDALPDLHDAGMNVYTLKNVRDFFLNSQLASVASSLLGFHIAVP